MKRAVTYSGNTFSPLLNTINLAGIPNFDIRKLFAIVDVTASVIVYAAGAPGLGYSLIAGTTLTLEGPLVNCAATDSLMIIYDDSDQATSAAVQNVAVAYNGQLVSASNSLPVAVDAQASGLAQDTSVQSTNTALGTIGSAAPSLPGSSSGIMGLLRWLGSLLPNANSLLQVSLPGDTIAQAAFTRPGNTTAYSAGTLVANSISSGSVAPMIFTVTRSNGLACRLKRVRLQKSTATLTNAQFVLRLYTVSPGCANGDGGVWLTNQSLGYVAEIPVTITSAFSDGSVGFGAPAVGTDVMFQPGSSQVTIYGLLSAAAAYTPGNAEIFTATLEVTNDE
jgi:hypothetical protein